MFGVPMKLSDFLSDLGRTVTYSPNIAKLIGVKETVFLCQFLHWDGKQRDPEGWIFKSQDEIFDETGLSEKEQRTARKNLKRQHLIDEKEDRLAHRMFYRVNKGNLNKMWDQRRVGSVPESPNGHSPNSPTGTSGTAEPSLRLTTESTSESTTKTEDVITKNGNGSAPLLESEPSPFRKLTDCWCAEYEKTNHEKYVFSGRDGKAAAEVLKAIPPKDFMATAREAWRHREKFWCGKAATLHGLFEHFNNIRFELKAASEVKCF